MQQKILSVSIAAYNVENYLPSALESIVNCPLASEIEAIVVNDGSKDETLSIAEEYSNRFPDVVTVINKENGGYGSTINSSIGHAKGKYFRLLDGDDWFDSLELEKLVRFLRHSEADLVVTKYRSVRGADEREEALQQQYDGKVYPVDGRLDSHFSQHMLSFKTSILLTALKAFPITEHVNYTDMEFILKAVIQTRTISYLDVNVYRYRLGREGQSVELRSWFKNIDSACSLAISLSRFYDQEIKTSSILPSAKKWALTWCVNNAFYKCQLIMMMGVGSTYRLKQKNYLLELSHSSPDVFSQIMSKTSVVGYALNDQACRYAISAFPKRCFALLQNVRGR